MALRISGRVPALQAICIQLGPKYQRRRLRRQRKSISYSWSYQSLHGFDCPLLSHSYGIETPLTTSKSTGITGDLWGRIFVSVSKIQQTLIVSLTSLHSVCIVSAIRISAVLQFSFADPTYTMWHTIVWSQLEPTLGIVCSCVPLMRPIFARFFPHTLRNTTKESNSANGSAHRRHTFSGSDDHTYPLTEFGNQAFIEADIQKSHGTTV